MNYNFVVGMIGFEPTRRLYLALRPKRSPVPSYGLHPDKNYCVLPRYTTPIPYKNWPRTSNPIFNSFYVEDSGSAPLRTACKAVVLLLSPIPRVMERNQGFEPCPTSWTPVMLSLYHQFRVKDLPTLYHTFNLRQQLKRCLLPS